MTCDNCNDKKRRPWLVTTGLTEAELLSVFESEVCPNCGSTSMERDTISGRDRMVCNDCLWLYTNVSKADLETGEPEAIGPESTLKGLSESIDSRDLAQRAEMQSMYEADRGMIAEYHMMVKREGQEAADEWLKKERELRRKHPKSYSYIAGYEG